LEDVKKIDGAIQFKNVELETERGKLLKGVSFTINPGESVALVGPSGSGKSTVLRMISRLTEPTSGEILIDGRLLSNIQSNSLRQRIGVVNQDTFLFNNTIMNNLMYLSSHTRDIVEEIAERVKIDSFTKELPDGFDHEIGENGSSLSGGQRQRLAIARTLLKDCDIFMLDEATSAIDRQNEKVIMDVIQHIAANKTCLFVAHRLETVIHADRILVFDNGRIVEEGTHRELLNLCGCYAALWETNSPKEERR
jgi:ABC-type multidrug transport system fused ATPase/permease subunit